MTIEKDAYSMVFLNCGDNGIKVNNDGESGLVLPLLGVDRLHKDTSLKLTIWVPAGVISASRGP